MIDRHLESRISDRIYLESAGGEPATPACVPQPWHTMKAPGRAVVNGLWAWEKLDFVAYFRSYITRPPTTVNIPFVSLIVTGGILKISLSSMTKSASFPTASVPL